MSAAYSWLGTDLPNELEGRFLPGRMHGVVGLELFDRGAAETFWWSGFGHADWQGPISQKRRNYRKERLGWAGANLRGDAKAVDIRAARKKTPQIPILFFAQLCYGAWKP
jgi:hypothetical protein